MPKKSNTKKSQIQVSAEEASSNKDSDPEYAYETELAWCVEKLKLGLDATSSKKHPNQIKDAQKVLKILTNPNSPKPKIRQTMRAAFGDYRLHMKKELKENCSSKTNISISSSVPTEEAYVKSRQLASTNQQEKIDFTFDFEIVE